MTRLLLIVLVLLMVAMAEAQPNKPKKIKCKDRSFPQCYRKDLYCPDACPNNCDVDCASCQAVCRPRKVKCRDPFYRKSCKKELFCPAACPRTCTVDCPNCTAVCLPLPPTTPSPPPPPVITPSPPPPPVITPSPPPPPVVTPSSPPPPVVTPPPPVVTPSSPPPPVVAPSSPPPPVVIPSSPPPTPTWPPPPDSSEAAAGRRVRCRNRNYTTCYYQEHRCPAACPNHCEVDCVTCSPVCICNMPGAVCQDPRFIGGDGITFYFHGKKDKEFCIVSDNNLHINAHFIGRRNENMGRDFTWVQSLGILFDKHQISVGAKKTATWDVTNDRLEFSYDGLPIQLAEGEGATWTSPGTTFKRTRDTNSVVIEVEGNFKIKATVVPITKEDSKIHKYGVTDEDCLAHLDLGFKFYSLSGEVSGVLGQTYASNYVSRVKMGIDMPVLGGHREFASSSLFSTDCAAARFKGTQNSYVNNFEYANLKCASGIDGKGVVCKR